ncbi:MAG TPA: hypothetical protein VEU47_17610, partial [Candidatus Cybelea sp.]|nr:hypothetical protein [Candidatus Cybelea sp.]
IGDTVNTASRLQDLTRTLDTKLVVGDAVMQAAGAAKGAPDIARRLHPGGERQLRGRVGAIKIWTLDAKAVP